MKNILFWIGFGFFAVTSFVMTGLYLIERNGSQVVMEDVESDVDPDVDELALIEQQSQLAAAESSGEVTRSNYSAKVGKFSLSLDPQYTIIVTSDGEVEGVASTSLRIARTQPDGVVANYFRDTVNIEAYPTKVNGGRDQFITSDTVLQASTAREDRTLVSGIEARRFTVDNLGETKKLFFENNGITYLIEGWDTSKTLTNEMLNHVVNNFSFN